MKNIVICSLLLILLGSCGMSNNFNSQKFTSLKKIKPAQSEVDEQGQFENDHYSYEDPLELKTEEATPVSALTSFVSDEETFGETENSLNNEEVITDNQQIVKIKFSPTPIKEKIALDNNPEKSAEEKKENNMFWWMMVLFILAAPASIFVVVPAIPFYLAAFILAILLIRRINNIPFETQTQKQKRRKGLAIWVLVQWAIGLGIFAFIIYS